MAVGRETDEAIKYLLRSDLKMSEREKRAPPCNQLELTVDALAEPSGRCDPGKLFLDAPRWHNQASSPTQPYRDIYWQSGIEKRRSDTTVT